MSEVNERYHKVTNVVTGIIEGLALPPNEPGMFTGINLDLHVTLDDGQEIVGRFLLADDTEAEQLASMLQTAAAQWRERTS